MAYTAEIFTSSIVVVGDFNPAIFSPDWLEKNGLIGRDDAEAAREGTQIFVTHQVTGFETSWFALQVLENQFILTSKSVLTPALKDLGIGVFQLVPHTPVQAMGLNFMGHFKLASEDEYHRVGDALAPKPIWNELFADDEHSTGLGNLTIRVQHGVRGGKLKSGDEKLISIQPSGKLKNGVYLSYNDHHVLRGAEERDLRPAERVAAIIEESWDTAWKDSIRVFDGVISKALST